MEKNLQNRIIEGMHEDAKAIKDYTEWLENSKDNQSEFKIIMNGLSQYYKRCYEFCELVKTWIEEDEPKDDPPFDPS